MVNAPIDRPIIFSAPMVRALLDDRKTQTRRLATSPLSRTQAGDRLWVREAWQLHSRAADLCTVVYGASANTSWTEMHERFPDHLAAGRQAKPFQSGLRPSIHMPRWASRLTLIVEGVKVEPLNDINEADALAEGVDPWPLGGWFEAGGMQVRAATVPMRTRFAVLWSHLHGSGAWSANPHVVAVTFRVIRGNIDRLPATP
jgi:hypothetical protein